MSLIPYYLQYVSEICEGTRKAPAGIVLTEQEDLKKALQLQAEITKLGIPAFVKACAEADGTEIPQEEYDSFDPAELNTAIAQLAAASQPQEPAEEAPQEPVRTETRDIFEIFLDSVCLDDALLTYLIDILKRRSEPEFAKLSHAAARTELKLDDFLAWLGNMELLAGEDEQACAAIMDKCLYRLEQEGEMELIAALLSGDETTFKLFRTQAPELVHLPDATYDWYSKYYLDGYYPIRFILRQNGTSDRAGLDGARFGPGESDVYAPELTTLDGIWQDALGETLVIDTGRMEYLAYSPDGMTGGTIRDGGDGLGVYLFLNGRGYFAVSPDGNSFTLFFEASDTNAPDGTYEGVFYRDGDADRYADLDNAEFYASDGHLRYYDGENIFFLPDTYAVAADGLAYDGAGNAYAAGWETPYYDPADDWGDNWASNWG
mgnify:CR=1 FL=1